MRKWYQSLSVAGCWSIDKVLYFPPGAERVFPAEEGFSAESWLQPSDDFRHPWIAAYRRPYTKMSQTPRTR